MRTIEGNLVAQGLKVGIVVGRFNEFIVSKLLGGAIDGLKRHGVEESEIDVAWVPGAFELPLVTWLLSLLGVVNKSFLRKYRRHAVVIIVIAAAIITPTGDPFTLSVVAIPLYLLYEMSILMIKDKKKTEEEIEDEIALSEE